MVVCKKNTNKDECTTLSTFTTTEPKVSRFIDSWVHSSSPLDIDLDNATPIILPSLIWSESETIPLKMSIRNIGMTCNVDAEYSGPRPSLSGSILQYPYEFSSFHFHWGTKHDNGSEHRRMGKCSPMEIHLVFYNISYSNTSEAFNAQDGKLILTYMCKLDRYENIMLDNLTSNLKNINKPGELIEIDSFALSSLFDNDLKNYYMYWSACEVIHENIVLWIISSKEISINESQLSCMRSLRGFDNKYILSNCRLAKLSGGNKVLRVTQHSMDQKEIQSMEGNDDSALVAPEKTDMPGNMVKSSTSAQTMQKEPEPLPNKSNINSDTVKKEDAIISVVTTTTIANPIVINATRPKKDIIPTKSLDLEDQRKDAEHILNFNKEKNVLNDLELTKNLVIRSIDDFIFDLKNYDKMELKTSHRPEVQKTHREGVRMNATALRREMHIKNKDIISTKSHDTEDQREEMELVPENFESVFNLMQPLDKNNKEKNILNDLEQTNDMVISPKDSIISDLINKDKVEVKTSQRPSVKKTHREGVRMNATALRREMHIKNRQQKNNENPDKNVHTF